MTGFCILMLSMITYFFPSVVANIRRHHNTTAIFLLNLFLGWTLLGWIAAMIWAVTATGVYYPPVRR